MKRLSLAMIIIWCVIGSLVLGIIAASLFFNINIIGRDSVVSGRSVELLVDQNASLQDVEKLKLEIASDECDVILTDANEVTVKHYGRNLRKDHYVDVSTSGKTLTISTNRRGIHFSFGFISSYSHVEVYLPKSFKNVLDVDIASGMINFDGDLDLTGLDIDVSSGSIKSSGEIKAETVNLSITSGLIKLEGGLSAKDYNIKASSGSIRIDERLAGSGKVNVTSGTIKLFGVEIAQSLDVKASSGTVSIEIEGDPSLDFSGRKSSGTIRTYFDTLRDKTGNYYTATVGSAPYKELSVGVTSGTINVTQK